MQSDSSTRTKRERTIRRLLKGVAVGLVAAMIYMVGLNVGNGTISFGNPTMTAANKTLPNDLDYASVESLYDLIRANYDGELDANKLMDGLKSGLARATGDPYTQYLNAKESQEFSDELNGSFTGIGAELGENEEGNLIIVSPISGFPASKAGLRPQDVIVSIDGTSTSGMSINEAITRIRGEKGTKVTLRILRNSEDLSITIERAEIKIPSVKWELLDGKVGSIQINQFGADTTELMTTAAKELKQQGAESILLDLRGNPGGLLDVSVEVASMWLPDGKRVLQERRGSLVIENYVADNKYGTPFKDMKTAILINAGSASASEILAGALRDHNVATIYGEKSYGKGSVQKFQDFPGGGSLKITVARWYRPSGENIDKKGIKPDVEVKVSEEDYEQKRDPQKDRALESLR